MTRLSSFIPLTQELVSVAPISCSVRDLKLTSSATENREYEKLVDKLFLNKAPTKSFRVETYRSSGNVSSSLSQRLRCYFVSKCEFVNPTPTPEEKKDIRICSDRNFLERASENTLSIYQEVMQHALERSGPVVEAFQVENSREHRLVVGFKQGSTSNFFSALSKLYHWFVLFAVQLIQGRSS